MLGPFQTFRMCPLATYFTATGDNLHATAASKLNDSPGTKFNFVNESKLISTHAHSKNLFHPLPGLTGVTYLLKDFGRSRSSSSKVSHDCLDILQKKLQQLHNDKTYKSLVPTSRLHPFILWDCNVLCQNFHCRYVQAKDDRVTVIFSTVFKDDDDVIIGKVFMQVSGLSFCLTCYYWYICNLPLGISLLICTWILVPEPRRDSPEILTFKMKFKLTVKSILKLKICVPHL